MLKALIAGALFGVSTPISKLLLGEIAAPLMAAFLYLGSGMGLFLLRYFQSFALDFSDEARLGKQDWPWLIGAIFAGGIAAPIVLMFSLKNTPAATASLLLNFEGAATAIIAIVVFKEAVGRRIWSAVILITLAIVLLSWNSSGQWGMSIGAIGVIGACIFWGMDNNFTRNISAKDPLMIVMIKGLSAGTFSLIMSLVIGYSFPALNFIIEAMLLGCFSYGLSIILVIKAMRDLGSTRTSALFGTAPFVGTLFSVIIFKESLNLSFFLALPIMVIGAALLLEEDHDHLHEHEPTIHEHRHTHDSHHSHNHCNSHPKEELLKWRGHSHVHEQELIVHKHPHKPDIHHRHRH